MKYTLINQFDVWGNEVDGYEVNNQCVEMTGITITDDATDKDIIKYLIDVKFLVYDAFNLVEVVNSGDLIELFEAKTGCPICYLMPEYQ